MALATAGFGLWLGLFPGPAPIGLTLIPASIAAEVILLVLSMLYLDAPAERLLGRRAARSTGRAAARWRRAATWPRTIHSGLVAALDMVRRRDPSLLGAVAYWGFDIAALWACFQVDLLVIGSHRYRPIERVLEDTASQQLADEPSSPLLVLAAR